MQQTYTLKPVAIAHTAFKQKFAIPRQAGLVLIPATIELIPPYNQTLAVAGLEKVTHIWLTFIFNQHFDKTVNLQVRPPRLGGNQKIGVFATRSSFRPNAIGQSVVQLTAIEQQEKLLLLHVLGLDVLDQTPILDIKPYLPYADCIANAVNLIAPDKPNASITVTWSAQAKQQLQQLMPAQSSQLYSWISELIAYDPRPAYKHQETQANYSMQLYDLDIHWQITAINRAEVSYIERL